MRKYMKKISYFLAMLLAVSVFTLTACGSKEETETITEVEAVVVEESVSEEAIVEDTETVVAEETVVAKELEKELYIPKGIDMESTLPGEEWIQSFIGVVSEPVVVIYSDITGRKDIIHDGDKVHINPDEDMVGIFFSEGCERGNTGGLLGTEYPSDKYTIFELDSQRMREAGVIEAVAMVLTGEEDWVINFRIIVD